MALRFLVFILLQLTISNSAAQEAAFSIGVGDTITVSVYNEPDLFVRDTIDKSKTIKMPMLGDIIVVNKTPDALAKEIEEKYFDGYLVNPMVTVNIEKFRPIYVKGAVESSGVYDFRHDLTVEQAIAIAGGLTDRASSRSWFVMRKQQPDKIKVVRGDKLLPGDILMIEESLF